MKLKHTPFTIEKVKNWHPVRWVRTQYQLWKLRKQDPFTYEDED